MKNKWKRVIMAFLGVFITGVSVAMFKTADFGTDPFTCFNLGIWNMTGIPYSIEYTIVTALLLTGVFVVKRNLIGIATVLNLLFIGLQKPIYRYVFLPLIHRPFSQACQKFLCHPEPVES